MKSVLVFCIGLFAGLGHVLMAQENAKPSPVITLVLPSNIASENAQISYFMYGPFGAYGGYVETQKGHVSYDIRASVEGKSAISAKIIAYLPGCEIEKLEIAIQGLSEARTLACRPLGQVPMHGRILSVPLAEIAGVAIEIRYMADWDHEFFGIADGMVTAVHVATVIPDENGRFDVELPDFFRQTDLGRGSFQLILRNQASHNIIAFLKPENAAQMFGELAVSTSYAPFVLFSADRSVATPVSTEPGATKEPQNK